MTDIKATARKGFKIIDNLLPAHALSGCDTFARLYGIGKGTIIKILQCSLSAVGNLTSALEAIMRQSTSFMFACYGSKSTCMSEMWLQVWGAKNGKGQFSSPQLCSLPPTTEAFIENANRAHFQAVLWRNLEISDLLLLDPEEYGWKKDMKSNFLIPDDAPDGVKCAPDYILDLIRCGCKTDNPCTSKRCSCRRPTVHRAPYSAIASRLGVA